MHPSTALIVWLVAVLASQFIGYAGLALLALGLLVSLPKAASLWLGYARRARFLILTLWLIMAYNTPGEAVYDLAWMPTYEGIAEADRHAVRLLVMLGCVAWLFGSLGRDGLVSGLWGLLQPLRRLGVDIRGAVVRLSLVLENLQAAQHKGAWRRMLEVEAVVPPGPHHVHLVLPHWRWVDSLTVGGAIAAFAWVLLS